MPDGVFHVEVLTPEERLVDTGARAVVLRTSDGDLTVLDGHTPLVTDVVPGRVRVDQEEGEPLQLAVHGGYMQVDTGPDPEGEGAGRSTRVTVLAGVAELRDQIDVARAERARDEAEAKVEQLRAQAGRPSGETEAGDDDAELAMAEADLGRARVRLEVAAD